MKRLGIVGCGFLGNIIANAWKQGLLEEYELVTPTSSYSSISPCFQALAMILPKKPQLGICRKNRPEHWCARLP